MDFTTGTVYDNVLLLLPDYIKPAAQSFQSCPFYAFSDYSIHILPIFTSLMDEHLSDFLKHFLAVGKPPFIQVHTRYRQKALSLTQHNVMQASKSKSSANQVLNSQGSITDASFPTGHDMAALLPECCFISTAEVAVQWQNKKSKTCHSTACSHKQKTGDSQKENLSSVERCLHTPFLKAPVIKRRKYRYRKVVYQ